MINPSNLCPGCMNEKVTDGKCPICGYNPDEIINPIYLKPGTVFEERYIVGKVIDVNGEGVTYLGFDSVTSSNVNIREFFPSGLCEREADGSVAMLLGKEFNYNDALLKFVDLSKALFKLNELPALFDVLDIREANNTAYRITRAVPGISLREFLMRNGGMLKWDQARSLFAPLVSSISALHKAGIIHRGISPDTLIVGKDGKLRISGFCVEDVRTATSALTSQLFPGFAAAEQYDRNGAQGTWTDVYSFAATIYRTLVGNPPPEAIERLENDNMTIPAKIARETPKEVLETLANALQVLPDDRTQYIDDMRKGLSVSAVQTDTAIASARTRVSADRNDAPVRKSNGKPKKNANKMYGLLACIVTVVLLAVVGVVVMWGFGMFNSDDTESTSSDNGLNSTLSVPSVTSKTDIEFNKDVLAVPKFVGLLYADTAANQDFASTFNFKVVSKEYNENYEFGEIISQSPKENTTVEPNTTIEVVVSLGPYYRNMTDLTGMDKNSALLMLLKEGYHYQNIEFIEKYDDTDLPGLIIETIPAKGTSVNADSKITIVVNSYKGFLGGGTTNNTSSESHDDVSSEQN